MKEEFLRVGLLKKFEAMTPCEVIEEWVKLTRERDGAFRFAREASGLLKSQELDNAALLQEICQRDQQIHYLRMSLESAELRIQALEGNRPQVHLPSFVEG
jgi:hypothetical protein